LVCALPLVGWFEDGEAIGGLWLPATCACAIVAAAKAAAQTVTNNTLSQWLDMSAPYGSSFRFYSHAPVGVRRRMLRSSAEGIRRVGGYFLIVAAAGTHELTQI